MFDRYNQNGTSSYVEDPLQIGFTKPLSISILPLSPTFCDT